MTGTRKPRGTARTLMGAALACALAVPARAAGDAEKGREIAEAHCSRCHVVGDFNRMGGISSTPSFRRLVNIFKDFRQRFRTFYLRRPHPVFIQVKGFESPFELPPYAEPFEIALEDVDHILAFALTLREEKEDRTE